MEREIFAKIPNTLMSIKTGEKTEKGTNVFTNEGSILDIVKDDKVIKVITELYLGSDFRYENRTTINYLIEKCNYKSDKDNVKAFKNILNKLDENGYINIKNEYKKANDLIIIDTVKLFECADEGYTILEPKELEAIDNITDNNRFRNNLLKVYFFIKLMCHKREDNTYRALYMLDGKNKPQTTSVTYEYINKFTGVTDITKCINALRDNKLIMFDNIGSFYKTDKAKSKPCANTYVVVALQLREELNDKEFEGFCLDELKLGMKQYEKEMTTQGYIINHNGIKNNNYKLFGLKGSLVKKQNNNTITQEELKILEEINADEQEQQQYKPTQPKHKVGFKCNRKEEINSNSDAEKHNNRNRRSFYDDDTWGTEEPNMYEGEWEEPKTKIKNDKDYQEFLKSLNPNTDDSWINDLL